MKQITLNDGNKIPAVGVSRPLRYTFTMRMSKMIQKRDGNIDVTDR